MTRFSYALNRFTRLALFAVGLIAVVGIFYGWMSRARAVAAAATQLASTDGVWQPVERAMLAARPAADIPQRARTFTLNPDALTRVLNTAARENGNSLSNSQTVLQIPLPSGDFVAFQIEESSVLDARLTKQFPEIKSFRGVAVNDGRLTMRADWTPQGFHALILTPERNYNVLPVSASTTSEYAAYDAGQRDADTATSFECFVQERNADKERDIKIINQLMTSVGPTRRNYRIAISATNEYCATYGGSTLSGTVASLNTWLNGINAVYERELNIHLNMVSANNVLFYANANDPYSNGNPGSMLSEVRPVLRDIVGESNFDIGHVIGTGGAGVAWLGVVCDNGNANGDTLGPIKGGGVSCISGTVGSASPLNLIMHEIGHQFGAAHSFNAGTGQCGSNRSPASGVEPGSGSTIMSYAGNCGADNVAGGSDLRFHAWSFRQITNYVNAETCNTATSTGNNAPTVNGGSDYTIPRLTPFELTAVGNDADVSDVASLTYAWEQVDAGNGFGNPPYTDQNDAANSTRPLFRAYSPNASPVRTFPALNYILNYANTPPATLNGYQTADFLSYINRPLNFRVVARDQRGGVTDDEVRLTVNASAGPFLVTTPNTNVIWPGGSQQTVTWSVNNTNTAPINCANVRLLLSTDGGLTFPHTLASSTANDGSETVTVPGNLISSTARVKVQAIGNVFFDIADANFSITVGGTCPAVASISPAVGNVGTVVTISGANFTSVSAVRFGNASATFTIANDATIQATVPSGAGGGPLTIIKASCANASTPAFTLCPTAATILQIDDATFEQNIGYSSGTQYFVNRLTPNAYPATLTTVSVAVNRPAGTVFEVIVGTNIDGNNNIDGTGFQAVSATSTGAQQFISVNVPVITINAGDFVVGYRLAAASGVFPGALDNNSTQQRSYASNNGTAFSTLDSLNYPGNLGIRASVYVGTCNSTGPVCPTITLNPATASNGVLDTTYSQIFTASGGNGSYSYRLVNAATLPLGLTLSNGGVISGTPTGSGGNYTFTVEAVDTNGCIGSQTYTINIATCAVASLSPMSTNVSVIGGSFNFSVTAPGCAWTATSQNPSWLTVTTNASGTGNLVVGYTVAPNVGAVRTGLITVNNLVFTVNQAAGNGLQYYPLAKPIRLYDTRASNGGVFACAYLGAQITNALPLTRSAFVTCDGQTIPNTAKAIAGNATVVNPAGQGNITLWPDGQTQPPVSNLNYVTGQIIGNGFTVGVDSSGNFVAATVATTDLIIDIVGYYAPPNPGGLYYHPLPKPIRLFDSRSTIPGFPACEYIGAPFSANTDHVKQARLTCEGVTIPSDAAAITGNLAAVGPGAAGVVTLWPEGVKPSTIALSYAAAQVIANNFTVKLDASGNFHLNTTQSANLIVDVMGYYSSSPNDVNGAGLYFVPLGKPIRLYDTRATIPGYPACEYLGVGLTATQTLTKQARGTCNGETIPLAALAILGNATVIGPGYAGHISLWPSDQPQPPVSNLNYLYGEVLANGFTIRLGADGQFKAFTVAPTNFVVDLSGYFAP